MNVYLDMNVYYRPFDDQSQPRIELETKAIEIIFKMIDRWKYDVFWSYILRFENKSNPSNEIREDVATLASIVCSKVIEANSEIECLAKRIVENTSAKSKDALHLACAIYSNCEYFITCDNRFIRTIYHNEEILKDSLRTIKLVNPVDFVGKEMVEGVDEKQ